MGAVKQALLEELDAENYQQEREKEEQYLLEDELERQREEDLMTPLIAKGADIK
tara:strand:- start:112 stop:273 length:162 start_codon:yes stop_codon:yes gene_type:complete